MFFKDIENWSKKKVRTTFLVFGLFYLIFALVIPCVIVGVKYDLIKSSSTRLTGVGLILVVCIAVFLLKGVKRLFAKMPQDELKEQRLKFTCQMIYSLFLPVLGLVMIRLIKQNVVLACDTLTACIWSIIVSIVIDHTMLKYIEAEFDLRNEAKHKIAVNKRVATIQNEANKNN